jgi:hypothetical protein
MSVLAVDYTLVEAVSGKMNLTQGIGITYDIASESYNSNRSGALTTSGDDPSLHVPSRHYTIYWEMKVNATVGQDGLRWPGIFIKERSADINYREYLMYFSNDTVTSNPPNYRMAYSYGNTTNWSETSSGLALSTVSYDWHKYAISIDFCGENRVRYFFDGQLIRDYPASTAVPNCTSTINSTDALRLLYSMNGSMRDWRLYNKTFSTYEGIAVTSGLNLSCENLQIWYPMKNRSMTCTESPAAQIALTANYSSPLWKVPTDFYGANTHGMWGQYGSVSPNNCTGSALSNTSWHWEKFLESGALTHRVDMGLEGILTDYVYPSFETWTNPNATANHSTMDRVSATGWSNGHYNQINVVALFRQSPINRSGMYGLEMTEERNGTGNIYLYKNIARSNLELNTNYSMECYFTSNSSIGAEVQVVRVDTGASLCYSSIVNLGTNTSVWQRIACGFNATADSSSGYNFVASIRSTTTNGTIFIDDCRIYHDPEPYYTINAASVNAKKDHLANLTKYNGTMMNIISYMPPTLANISNYCYDSHKNNTANMSRCPPQNNSWFANLVVKYLDMLTVNGTTDYSDLMLEFWNEPYGGFFMPEIGYNATWCTNVGNWCFTDNSSKYQPFNDMYNATYLAVKAKYPSIRFGGPAGYYTSTSYGTAFSDQFIMNFSKQADFISTHTYECDAAGVNCDFGIARQVNSILAAKAASGGNFSKIYISEWNVGDSAAKLNDYKERREIATGYKALFTLAPNVSSIIYQWSDTHTYAAADASVCYSEYPNRWSMVSEPLLDNAVYGSYTMTRDFNKYHPINADIVNVTSSNDIVIGVTTKNPNSSEYVTFINKDYASNTFKYTPSEDNKLFKKLIDIESSQVYYPIDGAFEVTLAAGDARLYELTSEEVVTPFTADDYFSVTSGASYLLPLDISSSTASVSYDVTGNNFYVTESTNPSICYLNSTKEAWEFWGNNTYACHLETNTGSNTDKQLLNLSDSNWTMFMWFDIREMRGTNELWSNSNHWPDGAGNNLSTGMFYLAAANGSHALAFNTGYIYTPVMYYQGIPNFVAITYNGSHYCFTNSSNYKSCNLETRKQNTTYSISNRIGAEGINWRGINGTIYKTGLFKRQLSDTEITSLINDGYAGKGNVIRIQIDYFDTINAIDHKVYGTNTHSCWGLNSSDGCSLNVRSQDNVTLQQSNSTWHEEKFREGGIQLERIDMSLQSYFKVLAQPSAEYWTTTTLNIVNRTPTYTSNIPFGWDVETTGSGKANATISRSTDAHTGNYSVNITYINSDTISDVFSEQNLGTFEPGVYNASVWVKGNQTVQIALQDKTVWSNFCDSGTKTISTSTWTQISCQATLTTPQPGGYRLNIIGKTKPTADTYFLWDDVRLTKDGQDWSGLTPPTGLSAKIRTAAEANRTIMAIASYMPQSLADINSYCYDTTNGATRCAPYNSTLFGIGVAKWLWNATANGTYADNVILEIWNEPDIGFWKPVSNDTERLRLYLDLANQTFLEVRKVFPNMKIGGASTCCSYVNGTAGRMFLNGFLQAFGNTTDFVTYHNYVNNADMDAGQDAAYNAVMEACAIYNVSGCSKGLYNDEWQSHWITEQVNDTRMTRQYTLGYISMLKKPNYHSFIYQWSDTNPWNNASKNGGYCPNDINEYTSAYYENCTRAEFKHNFDMVSEPFTDNKLYPGFLVTQIFSQRYNNGSNISNINSDWGSTYFNSLAAKNSDSKVITLINKLSEEVVFNVTVPGVSADYLINTNGTIYTKTGDSFLVPAPSDVPIHLDVNEGSQYLSCVYGTGTPRISYRLKTFLPFPQWVEATDTDGSHPLFICNNTDAVTRTLFLALNDTYPTVNEYCSLSYPVVLNDTNSMSITEKEFGVVASQETVSIWCARNYTQLPPVKKTVDYIFTLV